MYVLRAYSVLDIRYSIGIGLMLLLNMLGKPGTRALFVAGPCVWVAEAHVKFLLAAKIANVGAILVPTAIFLAPNLNRIVGNGSCISLLPLLVGLDEFRKSGLSSSKSGHGWRGGPYQNVNCIINHLLDEF